MSRNAQEITMKEMPEWFPRALAIARMADNLGLEFREAEWLKEIYDKFPNFDDIPQSLIWYIEWLHSKSVSMLMTRRKRITL